MRGQAAIFPIGFAVLFGIVNGIAIFQPLVVEQRLKTIRDENGVVDHAADEVSPSDSQKKLPVRLEVEANKMRNTQMKEMKCTGVLNPTLKMEGEGEVEPVKVPASWYQFWK
ncbi:hypothetical protein L873DRAFT_719888 [Choiromyces venosus 120613-1]|uniref:Uncharacterized protein n=1 Tax=Choiromyces venosus 120613-1 TaxID=1336337 RepID=A0A3N4JUU6_9PEZI|nr:hypothetical protein L873DRAFT_719888 [Choiromyces venosus 120613-1]